MKKIDELLKRVEFFERLAVYGDKKSFLTRLAQEANYSPNPNIPPVGSTPEPNQSVDPNPPAPSAVMNMPADHITGYRPINPQVQTLLNKILVPAGKILPIQEDGRLGPETQKALSAFKQMTGKPASPAAIAQYYQEQQKQPARDPGAPVAPTGSGLAGIGNTQSTPGAGNAGTERPVPGPKA